MYLANMIPVFVGVHGSDVSTSHAALTFLNHMKALGLQATDNMNTFGLGSCVVVGATMQYLEDRTCVLPVVEMVTGDFKIKINSLLGLFTMVNIARWVPRLLR
jgi:predicted TIM-barrel enzyme